jgi:cell wall-associated NlpC family hydrolase
LSIREPLDTLKVMLSTWRGCVAVTLALLALGCAKQLATIEVVDPSASAFTSADAERSRSRSRHIVAIAQKHLGTRYEWGGASPAGFDCSGFVMYVYSHVGVRLPHNAAKQYRYGQPVTRERLEPGDIVYFDDLQHNGIYIGSGRFIHARRSGGTVMVSGLDESWYRARWIGGRRL